MIETDRVVEIISPMYGSAYHIGGHLVLTCKHLFREDEDVCCVRSKRTDQKFNAKVVWRSSTSDIALVELRDGHKYYEPVSFGKLPESKFAESIPYEFLGWPEWGNTHDSENERVAEIIHAKGEIRLAEVLSSGLHRLRVDENSFPPVKSEGNSPWQGCSGAAIVSGNCIIAVQSQHLRRENFSYLGVVLLSTIDIDGEWRSLLKKNGINPEFIEVPVNGIQSKKNRKTQSPIEPKVISLLKLRSQMTEMLCNLDYEDQKFQFMKKLKSNEKAAAFVITAPCEHTRRWLVYRLMKEVPNARNAIRFSFRPTAYFSEEDLWQNLASGLSRRLKEEVLPDRDSVIQSLCTHALSKPVIISIRDIDSTHERFEKLIFDQFWTSLNQMFGEYECNRNRESRVVLFVTRDMSLSIPQDEDNNCLNSIYLSPLILFSQDDIGEWLSSFSGKTSRKNDQEALLTRLRASPPNLEDEPGAVIHQLCKAVGLQKGILELESMWGDAS